MYLVDLKIFEMEYLVPKAGVDTADKFSQCICQKLEISTTTQTQLRSLGVVQSGINDAWTISRYEGTGGFADVYAAKGASGSDGTDIARSSSCDVCVIIFSEFRFEFLEHIIRKLQNFKSDEFVLFLYSMDFCGIPAVVV